MSLKCFGPLSHSNFLPSDSASSHLRRAALISCFLSLTCGPSSHLLARRSCLLYSEFDIWASPFLVLAALLFLSPALSPLFPLGFISSFPILSSASVYQAILGFQ